MGYSTQQDVTNAIADALSQGNPSGGENTILPIISIGTSITDTVSPQELNQYIRWADQLINARISSIYRCPLNRVNVGTFQLAMDVTAGDTQAVLTDSSIFLPQDMILIRDSVNFQELTINTVPDDVTITFTAPVTNSYLASDTTVELIRFPSPINLISARYAAAFLFDKYFAAQVEGNKSDYGKFLRNMANNDLNGVLSGLNRLEIADAGDYLGRRYYNPSLDDVINTNAEPKDYFKSE